MVLFPFCKEVSEHTDRFVVNGGQDVRPDGYLSGTDGPLPMSGPEVVCSWVMGEAEPHLHKTMMRGELCAVFLISHPVNCSVIFFP
jgi:hypothetical protein